MKKITLFISACLLLSIGAIAQSSFYYEDFRYENESRGFTVQKVNLGGQTAGDVGKRVGDIPDAVDTDPVFVSRPVNRIPLGTARDQRTISFKNVSGNPVDTNHAIEAWALMTTQDLSVVNAPSVSFWTQQRYAEGGNSSLSVLVSTDYVHGSLPSTATWTDETANIVGEIATSGVKSTVFVFGKIDLSAYTSSTVTVAFRNLSDASAYTDENKNGTFYVSDVNFELTPEQVADGAITLNVSAQGQPGVFDEPTASISDANFNPKYFDRIFTTETYSTRFLNGINIPQNEGVRFKVSDDYGPIELNEIRYSVRNAQKDEYQSLWKVEASNDDTTWTDVGGGSFTPLQYSASDAEEQSRTLDTDGIAYRYYRMVLAAEWPSNTGFIEFQEANFTVGSSDLSVDDDLLNENISVYPNPSNSIMNIQNNGLNAIVSANLVDLTGRTVAKTDGSAIDVSKLAKGIYLLKVTADNGAVTSKKVIVN